MFEELGGELAEAINIFLDEHGGDSSSVEIRMSPDVAAAVRASQAPLGGRRFPNVTETGGTILGVSVVISDRLRTKRPIIRKRSR